MFRRSLARDHQSVRISTVCRRCNAHFVGNSEPVIRWEQQHLAECHSPATELSDKRPLARVLPFRKPDRTRLRVLVVDDDPSVADSTVLVFEKHLHHAKAAYSAERAIALIKTYKPDLLLTDVKLKNMNGVELALRVCAEMPSCKILLISGQAETADLLDDAHQRGYDFEIVGKPIHPTELLRKALEMTGKN